MKRMVFDPLGMNNSSFVWQDKYEWLKAPKHNVVSRPTGLNKVTEANAAASLNTTAADFGKFVAALLQGKGLKKETAKLMLTPQIQVDENCTNCTDRPLGKLSPNVAWGLGWGLQTTDEGTSFWHWGDNGNSKAYVVAFAKQKVGVVFFSNSANGLSIAREIVNEAIGGKHPALDWLHYEPYNSPAKTLLKNILAQGAEAALRDYRAQRKGGNGNATLDENQMNRLGYDLLYGARRAPDAIAVFQLNVEDYPESFNVYDSLGEAYMVNNEKELAIKNYQKSLELNPNNSNGVETLKKLQEK
jgi:CubicO group peptidase (beta-lactamase class C family)